MVNPTLIIVWVFSWIAVSVMGLRLLLVKLYQKRFSLGDYLTTVAIFCVLARLSIIHVVLIWGNNNMDPDFRATHHFTQQEIYQRQVGGKLTIVSRFFYSSFLWLQKSVLLDFCRHLIYHLPWEKITMMAFIFIFTVSYVAVQVVTFSECSPLHLYWQVLPDPGNCSQAQVQLITLGVLNIVTNIMLIILPIPILTKLRRSLFQKIQLYFLFSLGFFVVGITIVRLPQNASHTTGQANRTTWASAELLTASLVANAPALYTLCKRKSGPKPSLLVREGPVKHSNYTAEDQSGDSEQAPHQHAFENQENFSGHSRANAESQGRTSTAAHNQIVITSDIDTKYSSRT